jgi:hypothetical protein
LETWLSSNDMVTITASDFQRCLLNLEAMKGALGHFHAVAKKANHEMLLAQAREESRTMSMKQVCNFSKY